MGFGSETTIADLAAIVLRVADRADIVPEHRPDRPGDILRLLADSSLAERLLGWRPTVDLETGVGALLAWHTAQGTDWVTALAEDRERNWEQPAP